MVCPPAGENQTIFLLTRASAQDLCLPQGARGTQTGDIQMSPHLGLPNSPLGGCEHSATFLSHFRRCDCDGHADPTSLPGSSSTLLWHTQNPGLQGFPHPLHRQANRFSHRKPRGRSHFGDTFPAAPCPGMSSRSLPSCYLCRCLFLRLMGPSPRYLGSV